ncbi:hypothetical protein CH337_22415, partial [Rhodoblastus acidophilus]
MLSSRFAGIPISRRSSTRQDCRSCWPAVSKLREPKTRLRWPASFRNGGRLQIGIPGRLQIGISGRIESEFAILRLIRKWLSAGTIENGVGTAAQVGTPQGAVISPLLANVYLHYVFDLWSHRWRRHDAKGDAIVIRYADDSVVGFEYPGDARAYLDSLRTRLAQFGLALNEAKTRILEFGRYAIERRARRGQRRPETFDFLSFTHICAKRRKNGSFILRRLTVAKRMVATLKALRSSLMRQRHSPLKVIGAWLKRVVQGYLNYHAVAGNLKRLGMFRAEVCRAWLHAINDRVRQGGGNFGAFVSPLQAAILGGDAGSSARLAIVSRL